MSYPDPSDAPSLKHAPNGIDLSVILPCYNAAPLIAPALETLQGYLGALDFAWEIVLVDDGSTDRTPAILANVLESPHVRVISLQANRGKGHAVKEGMRQAAGRVRVFTDIDLPYDLDAIARCYYAVSTGGYQAVFGNRRLAESELSVRPSALRRLGSLMFRAIAGTLIGRHDLDTQCGFKGFSAGLAERLFPLLTIDRFAFDVELCLLLVEGGVEIHSIPVRLVNHDTSTVTFFGSGGETLLDVVRIWVRKLLRRYNTARLKQPEVVSAG